MTEHNDDSNGNDVIISTTPQKLAHKWAGRVPPDEECYWRVSGTPRQTAEGCRIWFVSNALGGTAFAHSTITAIENGRIWFEPVRDFSVPLTLDSPSRGFTYADPNEINQRIRDD